MNDSRSSGDARLPGPQSATSDRGRILVPVLLAVMSALLFHYTYTGAPVVPVWDGWTWIAQAKSHAEGGLSNAQLLFHGQHFYALPAGIALLLGPLVDYSFRPFAFLCVLALVAVGIALYRLARASGLGRYESLVVFLTVASFRHYENLLCGFQLGLVLSVFLGTTAVIVADARRDRSGFVFALVLALASVASSSGGVPALIAVILVRWLDPRRPRTWLITGLSAGALLLALHFVITRVALVEKSFVAEASARLAPSLWPRLFVDVVKLVGGSLVGDKAATPVGFAVLTGTCALVVAEVRRTRRIDALSGLSIYSFLATLAVAVARSPFDDPTSRHAVFAAPMAGVCAIGLVRGLSARTALWPVSSAALALLLSWLNADAHLKAQAYRRFIGQCDRDTRISLSAPAVDGPLTAEAIARVNPGPTEFIRGLMQFTRERRFMIFSPNYHGLEVHDELPMRTAGAVQVALESGTLQFAGPGYVYNRYTCRFESGCLARLSVDLAVAGRATIGFIVRDANGVERTNDHVVVQEHEGFAVQSMRVDAAAGETLDAYVFAWTANDSVRIRSSTVVLLQSSLVP